MAYNVQISGLALTAMFDLKGPQTSVGRWLTAKDPAFPEVPNTASAANELELYWIGKDHWILRAPLEREADILSRPVAGDISVVLISDTLSFFRVAGPDAADILAIASPLDTRLNAFPGTGVTFTEAFGLKALVIRRPVGFDLTVERSFADVA